MDQAKMMAVIGVLVGLIVASFCVFTVDEREKALVLRLGKITRADYEPGLQFKAPIIETVR